MGSINIQKQLDLRHCNLIFMLDMDKQPIPVRSRTCPLDSEIINDQFI